MKPTEEELRKNPRFVEELGSTWEGYMTPLKAAHKTHDLKIEHPALGIAYLRHVPGDFIVMRWEDDEDFVTLDHPWHFTLIQKWLEELGAEFVKKPEGYKNGTA